MTRFRTFALACCALAALGACQKAEQRPHTAGPRVTVLEPALAMPGLERTRTLRVYLPPSYASSDQRYPVIYMHDGQNLFDDATSYAGEWGVDEILDELARTHHFEAIVVGVDNGGEKRMNELSPWTNEKFGAAEGEQYLHFLTDVVKPYVDAHFRTRTDAQSTAIFGSSMGGLESHYAIHERPDVYGKAGVFSPSYWFAPAVSAYTQAHGLPASARMYLYVGGKEGAEMTDGAQQMRDLLTAQHGASLTLNVVADAEHNESAWRADFARALIWLFELQAVKPPAATGN